MVVDVLSNTSLLEELKRFNMTESVYESACKDIDDKLNGFNDLDWSEIQQKYDIHLNPDTIRKANNSPFGANFRLKWLKEKGLEYTDDNIDKKIAELRKERIKLQTLNTERNRMDRAEARQELYYEYVGEVCETLPIPDFQPLTKTCSQEIEYVLNIADIHYGAVFESINNNYSPAIAKERFEHLACKVKEFIVKNNVNSLKILMLGDALQGVLRLSDLKINDSSVVKATVEVSRLIGQFLNDISSVVSVEYYHVPTANHTQTRNLGSKASELADEDLEYVISHYIKDLVVMNDRVHVHLANDGDQYIEFNIGRFNVIAGHGHTVKSTNNSLRDLSMLRNKNYDYAIFGHFHGGDMKTVHEGVSNDCEVIVAPSFIGSDPYSDRLCVGAKAACQILGFDSLYGHTETYKIILN